MSLTRGRARLFTNESITGTLTLPPFTMLATLVNTDATVEVTSGGDYTSTTALTAGLAVSGTGVPGATTVLSITDADTFELSANATASGSGVTLTFTPVAAAVTGRIVNHNLEKGYDLALTETDTQGRVDLKRWDGKNITGTIEFEINAASPVFPRQGSLINVSGFEDIDLNKKYTVSRVGNSYPKGAFVAITLTVGWNLLVEGAL
jgi:hypothetical protein